MTGLTRRALLLATGSAALLAGMAWGPALRAQEAEPRRGLRVQSAFDDGWLLTEEDRAAYAAADTLVESETFDLRDGADLPGGDIGAFRSSGLGDCLAACEADSDCRAFTFARSSHPAVSDRRMCWIKGAGTGSPVTGLDMFVSGIRKAR